MQTRSSKMLISSLWFQASLLTFAIGFAVLGYLAYRIHAEHPPIPARVLDPAGRLLFNGEDILGGQHVFQKYGLMQHGTIFGHGAYLGQDFNAEYLHRAAGKMLEYYSGSPLPTPQAQARVIGESKANRYDPTTGDLTYNEGQSIAFGHMRDYYADYFGSTAQQQGLKRPHIADAEDIRRLTAYFSWAAWVSTATRPGADYSYTNNWPPEPLVGNGPTAEAFLWSVLSLIGLLGGTGLVLFFVGRVRPAGLAPGRRGRAGPKLRFRPPEEVRLAPAQRATAWYFLVVAGLFLLQGLLGGANAHYHVEPAGFYGVDLGQWFPYNLTRTWHVQLALFFVSASYLAMGIFIAPMIAGHEPRHQDKLAIALFGAVVFVVLGSLIGECGEHQGRVWQERRLVLVGRPGLGISGPGTVLADPVGGRVVSVGGDPGPRALAAAPGRASRQSALPVPL